MSVDNFTASLIPRWPRPSRPNLNSKPRSQTSRPSLKSAIRPLAIKSDKINYLEADLAEAKAKREEAIRDRDKFPFAILNLRKSSIPLPAWLVRFLGW